MFHNKINVQPDDKGIRASKSTEQTAKPQKADSINNRNCHKSIQQRFITVGPDKFYQHKVEFSTVLDPS